MADSLYGPDGSLARFTTAARGIHDIAEQLRAQRDGPRAKVVREALTALASDIQVGDYRVVAAIDVLVELASDSTLAKLGRMIR